MIVLIDNYDSFVYNLARYVTELGFVVKVFRNDAVTLSEIKALKPTHLIISPGPCGPDQTGVVAELVEYYLANIPILGVCLGHQTIAALLGATVEKAKVPMHGRGSAITHEALGLFKNLPLPLAVGRYHSLIVSPQNFPACLRVTARSSEQEIMAFEHVEYPVYGVQFHPESVLTPHGKKILANFLQVEVMDYAQS